MRQEFTNSSIAWRIEFYNSYFAQISTKKGDFREVGVQNWQSNLNSFFAVSVWTSGFQGAMAGIFEILEPPATHWYQDVAPTLQFLLHRRIYSLWKFPPYLMKKEVRGTHAWGLVAPRVANVGARVRGQGGRPGRGGPSDAASHRGAQARTNPGANRRVLPSSPVAEGSFPPLLRKAIRPERPKKGEQKTIKRNKDIKRTRRHRYKASKLKMNNFFKTWARIVTIWQILLFATMDMKMRLLVSSDVIFQKIPKITTTDYTTTDMNVCQKRSDLRQGNTLNG